MTITLINYFLSLSTQFNYIDYSRTHEISFHLVHRISITLTKTPRWDLDEIFLISLIKSKDLDSFLKSGVPIMLHVIIQHIDDFKCKRSHS
jgi:hypothetical protein